MNDTDLYCALVLFAVLVGFGVKLLLDATKPKHPFTDAALSEHFATEERLALLEEQRARRSPPLITPTFIPIGNPAATVVSRVARQSGRRDPFAAAEAELDAELAATRASAVADEPLIKSLSRRTAP